MNQNARPPRSRRRNLVAGLVGLFATWQLVAVPAMNLILFVPRRPSGPPLHVNCNPNQVWGTFTGCESLQLTADRAGRAIELWTEFSGQEQGWSLFAPGAPPYSVFVAAEFQWADGHRDTLFSPYEPRDLAHPPLRAPLIHSRHHHFEIQFVSAVWYASPSVVAEFPHLWAHLPGVIRLSRTEIRTWLRWRLNEYLAANPHRGRPRAVVMKHRYISTPHPGESAGARKIEERPYARWHPQTDELDAFDPVTGRFVPLGEATP